MSVSHYLIHLLMDTKRLPLNISFALIYIWHWYTSSSKPISVWHEWQRSAKVLCFLHGYVSRSPNLQKQSTLCCLASLHLCYSILTQIWAVLYMQSTKLCLFMFTFPQVTYSTKFSMSLVWKGIVCVDLVPGLVCWYKIAYTLYVECLGETVVYVSQH